MKITTKITWDMNSGEVLEHEYYEYSGPLALCDRGAQSAAKAAASTAGSTAAEDTMLSRAKEARLDPFFQREMTAEHAFTPGQTEELLTAAGAPVGAETGAAKAGLEREAVRTRNQTALTKNLTDLAMARNKGLAGTSEQIAAQDVLGAKQLQQEGAAGEAGLFQTDTDAALKAAGIEQNAIANRIQAGKSGWFQNTLAGIKALTGGAQAGQGMMAG